METVYDLLMFIFNFDNDFFTLVDIYHSIKGDHPITYGDFYIEDGVEKPRDVILTDPEELLRKECLDYIFEIKVKGYD